MKYFWVQLESKSHSDAPNLMQRTIMTGKSRKDVDTECQRMKGIESWSIIRELTPAEVRDAYGRDC